METFSLSLDDPTMVRVLLGTFLIGLTASVVGVFGFLRKKALLGDAISHAILPGVAVAFLLSGTKNPLLLMLGAVAAGWLATAMINWMQRTTVFSTDTILAIILCAFFAIGLVVMSLIQGSQNGGQSGLKDFLFGKVAALSNKDIQLFIVVAFTLLVALILKRRLFYGIAFDHDFMKSKGVSIRTNETILSILSIFAIAMGIQAVGVVLMSALLIVPVASARMLVYRLTSLLLFAALFGITGAVGGSLISTSYQNMPTGPWIIMVLTAIALLSFLIGSVRTYKRRKTRMQQ
jgi:manganese/zinc/iron transport system permease protein